MRVTLLHPDFGIGGAERLILDAALAFDENGHEVEIVTNQFSEDHCFADALKFKDNIHVCAQWLPRRVFGRFYAFFAYLRLCVAALYVIFKGQAEIIFLDQITLPLLLFKLVSPFYRPKLVFYCHFPDQKLTKRDGVAKKVYRFFIDNMESLTIGMADHIYVNSLFTKSICQESFRSIDPNRLDVLYPSLKTDTLDNTKEFNIDLDGFEYIVLSLNRYEEKKNHKLALDVFNELSSLLNVNTYKKCLLVFAGGYDPINQENELVLTDLKEKAKELGLESQVKFYKSPSDAEKISLIKRSTMLFYTPENEHFGIVPLEAMFLRTPVLALRSGGPKETVVHNQTGFLVDPNADPSEFAKFLVKVVNDKKLTDDFGENGRKRVQDNFSFEAFTKKLLETAL